MVQTRQLAFRIPADLVDRIDVYVKRLREDAPWSNPTRAMAVRLLLTAGLDATERAPETPAAQLTKRRPKRR
jgi:hypothetical protein